MSRCTIGRRWEDAERKACHKQKVHPTKAMMWLEHRLAGEEKCFGGEGVVKAVKASGRYIGLKDAVY